MPWSRSSLRSISPATIFSTDKDPVITRYLFVIVIARSGIAPPPDASGIVTLCVGVSPDTFSKGGVQFAQDHKWVPNHSMLGSELLISVSSTVTTVPTGKSVPSPTVQL